MTPPSLRCLEAAGDTIGFRCAGRLEDPTVVLLHSLGTSSVLWLPQLRALSADHFVVAVDSRGHGASTNRRGFSIEGCAADGIAVLQHLGVEAAHVVGISMGGLVAAEMVGARSSGPAWQSMTLACSYRHLRGPASAERIAQTTAQLAAMPMSHFGKAYLDDTLSVAIAESSRRELEAAIAGMTAWDYLETLRCILSHDAQPALANVHDLPVLIINGELDRRVGAEARRTLLDAVPLARQVELSNAGHLANVEAPVAFDSALRAFWADRRSA